MLCVFSAHKSLLDSSKSHFDCSIFWRYYIWSKADTHICSHSLSPPLRCNTPTHESLSSSHRKHLLPRCPDVASPSLLFFYFSSPVSLSLVRSLYFPPSHSFLRFSSPSPPAEHTSPVLCTSHSFFFSPTFSSPVHFWAPFFYFSPVSRLVFIPVLSFKSNKIQWHEMTVLITEKIDCKALDQAWTSQSWSKNLFQCRYSMIVFFMFYSRPMLVPRVKN